MNPDPIDRVAFEAVRLLREHPPQWRHGKKRLVYEICCSSGFPIEGQVQGVARTVINTGFWGCGAFGGNRRLMTVLQCLAGDLAGVEIVFWASGASGTKVATEAHRWFERLREGNPAVDNLLDRSWKRGSGGGCPMGIDTRSS